MVGTNGALLTIVLTLGAVLLVVLIILVIKLMNTADKLNIVLDDTYKKLKSVDGIFDTIDTVSDAVTTVSETLVGKVLLMFDKVFKRDK